MLFFYEGAFSRKRFLKIRMEMLADARGTRYNVGAQTYLLGRAVQIGVCSLLRRLPERTPGKIFEMGEFESCVH